VGAEFQLGVNDDAKVTLLLDRLNCVVTSRILGHEVLMFGVFVSKVYDLAFFCIEFQQPSFDPGAHVVEISLEGLDGRRGVGRTYEFRIIRI
jgi:hypothetical protein